MSLSTCQGLQTCFEPRIVEPLVLRLKLDPPIEPLCSVSASIATTKSRTISGNDNGSWSSLFSLDGAKSQANKEANSDKDTGYVHPLAKRSAAKLSAESLAMCTESLGCETGDDISLLSSESTAGNNQPPSLLRGKSKLVSKKQSRGDGSFPPPLASSGGVRVRPHREGGRLVLKAVNVCASEAKFHAERSNGRLKLHLLTEHEEERERNCGGEMGIEKLEMPRSRCKEGGDGSDGLKNKSWESHFWVAT